MQRSSIASRTRVLAGSPLTPFLSALAAAGLGCGRQPPVAPPPVDAEAHSAPDRPDASSDALVELFRDASPDVIAEQLERMLDGAASNDSSNEASTPSPGPTTRTDRTAPKPTRDPAPRPIYRGVDV